MVCTHVNILSVNPITALDAGTKLYSKNVLNQYIAILIIDQLQTFQHAPYTQAVQPTFCCQYVETLYAERMSYLS